MSSIGALQAQIAAAKAEIQRLEAQARAQEEARLINKRT